MLRGPVHDILNAMSIDPSTERFEVPISVDPSDIDELGHVNNVVYLRWVQEAAISHWRARTTDEQQSEIIWVVVRHEIDYKHPAMPGDQLIARTWVGVATVSTFERHTEIVRASDQRLLAQARTLWVPMRIDSGRPTRVDPEIRRRFSVPDKGTGPER